jgi:hypothetical protein
MGVPWWGQRCRGVGSGGVVVQFMQLRGLTSLPIEPIGAQFHSEDVRAVLPARLVARTTEALLVATTSALAIVVPSKAPATRWKVHWAPLETVRLSDGTDPWTEAFDGEYQLFIDIGRVRFESHLTGETGRKVLRDFVSAVWTRPVRAMAATIS